MTNPSDQIRRNLEQAAASIRRLSLSPPPPIPWYRRRVDLTVRALIFWGLGLAAVSAALPVMFATRLLQAFGLLP